MTGKIVGPDIYLGVGDPGFTVDNSSLVRVEPGASLEEVVNKRYGWINRLYRNHGVFPDHSFHGLQHNQRVQVALKLQLLTGILYLLKTLGGINLFDAFGAGYDALADHVRDLPHIGMEL